MTQPKTPPISIRLSPFLVARVEAWAAERKTTRNAAIVQFIEAGLGEPVAEAPVEAATPPKLKGSLTPKSEGLPKLAEPAAGRVAVQFGPSAFAARLKKR